MATAHDVPIEHEISEAVEYRFALIGFAGLDHMRMMAKHHVCPNIDRGASDFPLNATGSSLDDTPQWQDRVTRSTFVRNARTSSRMASSSAGSANVCVIGSAPGISSARGPGS